MSKILGGLLGAGALLGAPLFVIIAGITLLLMWLNYPEPIPFRNLFGQVFGEMGTNDYFVAIPLFTFAGYLLAESKAPQRLVALEKALLGWLPGGMAIVAIVCCAFFTAFTGASGVTIIALGGFLMPALTEEKYPENFNLGLLTTGGSLGLLFPPSLPIIIYGMIAGASIKGVEWQSKMTGYADVGLSIDTLFLAGLIPGMLLVVVLSLYAVYVGKKCQAEQTPFHLGTVLKTLAASIFEVIVPFVIIAFLYSGAISISQIAPLTALYVLIVEVVIYRDIGITQLPGITLKAMKLVGAILIILVAAFGFNNALTNLQIPAKILAFMKQYIGPGETWKFLLLLNIFLLIVGCLLDIFSALLMVVPLIIPMAAEYGVHPVHLGVIFLTNLEIGYATPPVGINLFIASLRFEKPVMKLYIASIPWLILLLICLVIVTYVPQLSMYIPYKIEMMKAANAAAGG